MIMENITEEIFYNKELCDSIRDISIMSACSLENAISLLEQSNNYERDSFIIKKLSDAGISFKQVMISIKSINR